MVKGRVSSVHNESIADDSVSLDNRFEQGNEQRNWDTFKEPTQINKKKKTEKKHLKNFLRRRTTEKQNQKITKLYTIIPPEQNSRLQTTILLRSELRK